MIISGDDYKRKKARAVNFYAAHLLDLIKGQQPQKKESDSDSLAGDMTSQPDVYPFHI